ncbi:hypothetical protein PC129_g23672 [Phytophthora cactorum]|uniref:Uncharacterized protein n=1 Tax=Phytophthora cactorum TaxID=29920 RepID=A0A329RF51_9STRA|nr:hypothetical protein Pcac1_g13337 [Phytophthora cactorum]KAG2791687.1 hypothetical protein PC111_g23805 [Phytophthora cactorum]KAG2797751.1 hypothetical protein PC112_g21647 [Phytophthora cactorum]KAG2826694.1 hypothetical protein PC113_g21726 [Phytophthora cactorum]KAG2871685.1 hypothetical protein PC114_g26783 [Phytophthora cactorum]
MTVAQECYADWIRGMEEREQADRLSEAFWRADGGTSDTPSQQMRMLSGIQAERRALRAKMQASEDEQAARRGRRASVGRMSSVRTVATVSGTVPVPPLE